MSRTLMWEAEAADGRADDLVAWALAHADAAADVYRGADGRVVVIDRSGQAMPEPPPELLARPPHAWPFEPVSR
jgi:hypothetical protein